MVTAAEYSLGPHTFPRGWFVIAESKDLTDKPIALHCFGRDLVLYRVQQGSCGRGQVMCRRMNLQQNRVVKPVVSFAWNATPSCSTDQKGAPHCSALLPVK